MPERFNPHSLLFKRPDGKARHPFSFLPFGGGQRICLGKTFAEMMVRFTISLILYHVELDLVDPKQKEKKPLYQIGGREVPTMIMHKKARRPLKV
jgi:cytochrome P450